MEVTDLLSEGLENINWIGVVLATIATFVVGSIWYHEKVLGERWMKAVPIKKSAVENANMGKIFGLSAVLGFVSSVFLSFFIYGLGIDGSYNGALLGGVIGTFFVASTTANNYLFSQRKTELIWIDTAYIIVTYAVMGAVIAAFA